MPTHPARCVAQRPAAASPPGGPAGCTAIFSLAAPPAALLTPAQEKATVTRPTWKSISSEDSLSTQKMRLPQVASRSWYMRR